MHLKGDHRIVWDLNDYLVLIPEDIELQFTSSN